MVKMANQTFLEQLCAVLEMDIAVLRSEDGLEDEERERRHAYMAHAYPSDEQDPDTAKKTGWMNSVFAYDSYLKNDLFTEKMLTGGCWIFNQEKIRGRFDFLMEDGVMDSMQMDGEE